MCTQHLIWQEAHSEFPIHVSNCHYLVGLQFKPSELEQVPCPLWAEEPMVSICFILILETWSHHEKQLTVTKIISPSPSLNSCAFTRHTLRLDA